MTDPAVPAPGGRRFPPGMFVALVAYLVVAPPLFLLGPLLVLLVLSRPTTLREWLWIALSAGASYALASPSGVSLPSLVAVSGGAALAGSFAVLTHVLRRSSTLSRGLLALIVTLLAVVGWSAFSHLTLAELDAAVLRDLEATMRALFQGSPQEQLEAAAAATPVLARLFPGVLALQALAGVGLAAVWYHQVARRPVGRPPSAFRDFRFNDHLVWGAIFTLGLSLLPWGDPWRRIAQNGLVVWSGLYGARGLAVTGSALRRWPLFARLLLIGSAIVVLPIALGSLILVGLADTWMDFRGRLAPPPSGGTHAS